MDGELEKQGTFSDLGYKSDDINEGFEIFYQRAQGDSAEMLAGLSSDEMFELMLKMSSEYMNDGDTVDTVSVNGMKALKSMDARYNNEVNYMIALGDGKCIFLTVYSNQDAVTKHSAEIDNVLNSITIDISSIK